MASSPQVASKVEQVEIGNFDPTGGEIRQVYARVVPRYAVYRNEQRVMVHFADKEADQPAQEAHIAPLHTIRGQIGSLIDGWRAEEDERDAKGARIGNGRRAARYDRRVADALLTALQGNSEVALELLKEAKNDIVSERQSIARIDYMWTAIAVSGLFLLLMWIVSSSLLDAWVHRLGPPYASIWTAVSGGTLGALFSIMTGLNKRTILIDLQKRNNRADAALRVLIGAISGGILLCLLLSELAANSLINVEALKSANAACTIKQGDCGVDVQPTLMVFVLGFLAGFAERLLPDLLDNAKLALENKTPVGTSLGGSSPGAGGSSSGGAGGAGGTPQVGGTGESAASVTDQLAEANVPAVENVPEVEDASSALAPSRIEVDDPDAIAIEPAPLGDVEAPPEGEEEPRPAGV